MTRRYELQFMSGAFWRIETSKPLYDTPQVTRFAKVTRIIEQVEGPVRKVEAWINPDTVEGIWEVGE
jgi:hypothetical protein